MLKYFRLYYIRWLLVITVLQLVTNCVKIPEGIQPVTNFKLDRYLGKWYEIARLDNSYERGLTAVTAEYSLNPDGSVKVLNSGYSKQENKRKEAVGNASFVQNPNIGYLQVYFFWPFYGSYVIFDLDHEHYQYALVTGPDRSFLWILARTPTLAENLKNRLVATANGLGFDTDKLIFAD